jgi:hypothetical protein
MEGKRLPRTRNEAKMLAENDKSKEKQFFSYTKILPVGGGTKTKIIKQKKIMKSKQLSKQQNASQKIHVFCIKFNLATPILEVPMNCAEIRSNKRN